MNQNIVLSIITILFSGIFLIFSLQLTSPNTNDQLGPGGWPTFILTLMLILGIVLLIRGIGERKKGTQSKEKKSEIEEIVEEEETAMVTGDYSNRHWLVGIILVIYLFLMPLLGFLITTFIFVLLLAWLFGMKRWGPLLITAGVSSVVFTLIFVTLLRLPLPRGTSIFHDISLLF